jgi:hypothetical protein
MTPISDPDPATASRIDAYLDGSMPPAERAAFERAAESDPTLREELALQSRIDGRLRAVFTPPSASSVSTAQPKPAVPPIAGRIGLPAWLKVAAVLALVALGAWLAVARPWEGLSKPATSLVSADAAMKHLVTEEDFKPVWVCDSDQKFLDYTKEKLNVAFLVRPQPGVELVGWTYQKGLFADDAQVLLVRAEGKQLIVAMAPKADDRAIHTDPGSPLHITRNVYKGVVMYEISPLDHAVVVNSIKQP